VEAHFAQMPSISIDYGVLERSDRVRLVPCDIGWSDVGSWDAVHDLAEQDDRGNALHGNTLAIDCDNTLLHGNGRLVAAVGVRDLCVVETADAILIAPRGQTQRVREVVDELSRRGASECRLHLHGAAALGQLYGAGGIGWLQDEAHLGRRRAPA
jgi:mannose-1-phosphate guanylyltransferase / mannose-6-phosphate isomerase